MKRIIFCLIAVITFGFVNAQDLKYGVKGGLNVSSFSGDNDGMDLKSRVGFNIGGFVEVKLSEKFAIQPEVLYSQQGTKFKLSGILFSNDEPFKAETKFNLSYINVPVMFKYYAIEKLFIEAGPQIGFLISAKSKTKVTGFDQTEELDTKDMYNTIDFGLNFGAGYDFTQNISLGARYNLGLANIAKTEAGDDGKLHNGVFSLSVGYKFK